MEPFAQDLADARAVLVGQVTDHVMGLSAIDPLIADDAVVLGTQPRPHLWGHRTRTPHPTDGRLAGDPDHAGPDLESPVGALRVRPIARDTPRSTCSSTCSGAARSTPTKPPHRVAHWQEGPTLGFLVDLMSEGRIQARVYIQSSSRGPGWLLPRSLLKDRPVDLAVVAMDVANREIARATPSCTSSMHR